MEALGTLTSDEERRRFLTAFLSPGEVAIFSKRWRVFGELIAGKSQRDVQHSLGVGIATVSRAARQLQAEGEMLRTVFSRCFPRSRNTSP